MENKYWTLEKQEIILIKFVINMTNLRICTNNITNMYEKIIGKITSKIWKNRYFIWKNRSNYIE